MRVRRAAAVAACMALALVSACSGDEPIAPPPLESTSPTATPTDSATEPVAGPPPLPAEARGTGRKAAVAFVRHWIDTLNYSAAAGDTDHLRALSTGCAPCDAIADVIDDVYSAGGGITTQGWVIRDIWMAARTDEMWKVVADVHGSAQVFRKPGHKTQRFEGGPSSKMFDLRPGTDGWIVTDLDQT